MANPRNAQVVTVQAGSIKSRDIYGNEYDVPLEQLSWRPAAYAIIVRDTYVLLVAEEGGYHLPGGGMQLGEMPEAALIREVKEETGLTVANPRLKGSLSTFFTLAHTGSHTPTHVQSLLLYYVCDFVSGTISTDGLEDDEKSYGLTPEWVPLATLDKISVGSTVDWRPILKEAITQRPGL